MIEPGGGAANHLSHLARPAHCPDGKTEVQIVKRKTGSCKTEAGLLTPSLVLPPSAWPDRCQMPAGDGDLPWGPARVSHLILGLWWPGAVGPSPHPSLGSWKQGPWQQKRLRFLSNSVMLHGRLTLHWLPAPKTSTKWAEQNRPCFVLRTVSKPSSHRMQQALLLLGTRGTHTWKIRGV